jgi:hypothetical protein
MTTEGGDPLRLPGSQAVAVVLQLQGQHLATPGKGQVGIARVTLEGGTPAASRSGRAEMRGSPEPKRAASRIALATSTPVTSSPGEQGEEVRL